MPGRNHAHKRNDVQGDAHCVPEPRSAFHRTQVPDTERMRYSAKISTHWSACTGSHIVRIVKIIGIEPPAPSTRECRLPRMRGIALRVGAHVADSGNSHTGTTQSIRIASRGPDLVHRSAPSHCGFRTQEHTHVVCVRHTNIPRLLGRNRARGLPHDARRTRPSANTVAGL